MCTSITPLMNHTGDSLIDVIDSNRKRHLGGEYLTVNEFCILMVRVKCGTKYIVSAQVNKN